jgi:hypothetical protein
MFGKILGKVLSAPVKIVNLPARAIDAVLGEDDLCAAPGNIIAEAIEDGAEYVCGDEDED